jgi:diaminopimelate decarboxylase
MDPFPYKQGELHCEGAPLRRLAERFGTPLYVYSRNHIIGQHQALDRAMRSVDHLLCYAVKANSNLAVIRALAESGSGFDIVSGGELYRVLQAGSDPRRCVFSGVGKTREEMEYALKLGIDCFNVESEAELKLLDAVGRRQRRRAPIALRVNPGVDPETHHYISTGKHESKFGISIRTAGAIYRQASRMRGVEIRGVQMHIGSQITTTTPFELAVRKMLPLIRQLPATLQVFDIGGGLGIRYRDENPPTAAQYAAAVLPHVKKLGLKILTEHGRFVVGNGGVLVTRVLYVKRTPVKNFIITDAAMNDLIRPALYGSYHAVLPVARRRRPVVKVDVVGPVCESGDFFAQDRHMPAVEAGELLALRSAGAYGMVMASNYNTRPRPAEVMVNGRRAELVRRRETWRDMIRGES